ncbi:hypothetical protein F4825DRAFT_476838 [Nemania diffusa]|nr:hypothetical protein F4825DRAFT_476838 [Nemania diffusa]
MAGLTHIPPEYRVYDMVPEAAWDCESRLLLGNIPCHDGVRALKVGMMYFGVEMILGLVFRASGIIVFDCSQHVTTSNKLFTRTHRRSSMNWDELLSEIPELLTFSDQLDMPTRLKLTVEVLPGLEHQFQLLIRVVGIPIDQGRVSVSAGPRELSLDWSSSSETTDQVPDLEPMPDQRVSDAPVRPPKKARSLGPKGGSKTMYIEGGSSKRPIPK